MLIIAKSLELMVNVVNSVLPAVQGLLCCTRKPTLADKHYPVISYTSKTAIVAASLLSFGPPVFISMAAPYPWNYISAFFYSGLGCLAPITPVTAFIDEIISNMGRYSRDPEVAAKSDLYVKLNAHRHSLEHASTKAFTCYTDFLSEGDEEAV
jgi:hypothetical protein